MKENIFDNIKDIYESMVDQKSKNMFIYKLTYEITGDYEYLYKFLSENFKDNNGNTIEYKIRNKYIDRNLIIYGALNSAKFRYDLLNKFNLNNISYFCDKDIDKQKNGLCGKRVVSPEYLQKNYDNEIISIESQNYYNEIYNELINMGIPKENILGHPDCGIQYFDFEYFKYGESEIFIDCGPFDGNDELKFKKTCNGKYKKIIAFEPDEENFIMCKEFYKENNIENVEIINKGVWNKKDILFFKSNLDNLSYISEEDIDGIINVDVVSIDEVMNNEEVTLIKMDIEGAEMKALEGAKETIKNKKPKLAICIYHKAEDVLEIPSYLKDLVPEYKFAIRHYTLFEAETVLYAWVQGIQKNDKD